LTVLGIALAFLPALTVLAVLVGVQVWLRRKYLPNLTRIFQEKPLFIVPRGQPVEGAQDVRFPTEGGLWLRGCYLPARRERKGVVLFGLEFGSNRWACVPYCEALCEAGYDVFAFEMRSQGDSDADPHYHPLQWVTQYDLADTRAALTYLKKRPDADPRGVGLFGISKGGSVGLMAAADDPYVRCCVTDGAYATLTVMVPFMRKWFSIYNRTYPMHGLMPPWYYKLVARAGLKQVGRERKVKYLHTENSLAKLSPRPLLMIHGADDTYIKATMAKMMFEKAGEPKEFWLIEGAKHNQALHVAGSAYHERVVAFFDRFLAGAAARETVAANDTVVAPAEPAVTPAVAAR
jgi:pimeloyl-ACP methyl ester carboxylesterase